MKRKFIPQKLPSSGGGGEMSIPLPALALFTAVGLQQERKNSGNLPSALEF